MSDRTPDDLEAELFRFQASMDPIERLAFKLAMEHLQVTKEQAVEVFLRFSEEYRRQRAEDPEEAARLWGDLERPN